jgi:predicted nucleic acid-binding protein
VLDTNILMSALGWRGPERLVYERCGAGVMELVTSPELLDELERVLRYPTFLFTESEIRSFLRDVTVIARLVHPRRRMHCAAWRADIHHRIRMSG